MHFSLCWRIPLLTAKSWLLACACFAFVSFAQSVHPSEDEASKDDPVPGLEASISLLPNGTEKEVLKEFSAGEKAQQRWDYADAIKHFSRALEKDPLNVLTLAYRGFMYARTGELDRALTDTTLAIKLDPKCGPAYWARAIVYRHRDELDKAIADLSESIRLESGRSSDDFAIRGDIYFQKGDMEKAMADYNRAIALAPGIPSNFCARGGLRVFTGDYTGAVSDYLRAQELDPKYSATYVRYAWLLATCADAQIRDPAKAVQYAKIGLDLNPKNEDAWAAYGAALAAAGRFDEAAEWQQRYASSKVHSEVSRIQAESTLALYKSHHAPLQPPPPVKKLAPAAQPSADD
jgi:tetratricopeptide (TPR) repeat protein